MALSTLTLTDFLLARISEDKAVARAMRDDTEAWGNPYDSGASIDYGNRFDPARVLTECEAKRRIVELHSSGAPDFCDLCSRFDPEFETVTDEQFPCSTLRALAAVHADHQDYRPEWRP